MLKKLAPKNITLKRTLTASVLLPLLFLLVLKAPAELFLAGLLLIFAGCAFEISGLLGPQTLGARLFFVGLVLISILLLLPKAMALILLVLPFWLLAFLCLLKPKAWSYLKKESVGAFAAWMILVPAACAIWFLKSAYSAETLLALLLIVFASDTGAYFVGKRFGRTLLAPEISPGKTLAGMWGAFGGAMIAALFLAPYMAATHLEALWVSILLAGTGLLGDLCESMLKRVANVKDSGTLLPGHGGLLDRMDSVLSAMPVFAAIKIIMNM